MSNKALTRFAAIEQKLDSILFRRAEDPTDDEQPRQTSLLKPVVAGTIATGLYAANKAANAMAPQIMNRRQGLSATSGYGGFRDMKPLAQEIVATGSVFKDHPLQAVKAGARGIAQDAAGLYRKAAPMAAGLLKKGRGLAGSLIRASAKPTAGERVIAMAAKLDA